MEEVFLRILGGNEAKATVRNDLLDCSGRHDDLQRSPNSELHSARSVRREGRPRDASPHSAANSNRSTRPRFVVRNDDVVQRGSDIAALLQTATHPVSSITTCSSMSVSGLTTIDNGARYYFETRTN